MSNKLALQIPDQALLEISNNFSYQMDDVRRLVRVYDHMQKDVVKGFFPGFEVLKRAGIILAITAWETFIEDIFTALFEEQLNHAASPDGISHTFNAVAQAWLEGGFPYKPTPPDLAKWTGTGWKSLILDKFKRDISELNTPNSQRIRKLSKMYLDYDFTSAWKWQGVTPENACRKLDNLIQLRGALVHRSRDYTTERAEKASRRKVVDAIKLVEHLAESIETLLNVPTERLPIKLEV